MGTHRIYFDDARARRFRARVVRVAELASAGDPTSSGGPDGAWVELDRTAFYPEGGGQPADHGVLGGRAVVDVQEEGGRIAHRVAGPAPAVGDEVDGEIDDARRWDHTQQHSAQHLLSRLLLDQRGLATLAFHLGREWSSVDVPADGLDDAAIVRLEDAANEVVRAGLPVSTRTLGPEDARDGLTKAPKVTGDVRVVVIGDPDRSPLDRNPCGGTHVADTAELEVVRVRRVSRVRAGVLRVEFVAGGRAHRDHRTLLRRERALISALFAEPHELVDAATRLRDRLQESERRVRELTLRLLPLRVDAWVAAAERVAGVPMVVESVAPESKDELTQLGAALGRRDRLVAVVAASGGKGRLLVVARGVEGLAADVLLSELAASYGGRGGGTAAIAQGVGPDDAGIPALLRAARGRVREALERALGSGPHVPDRQAVGDHAPDRGNPG